MALILNIDTATEIASICLSKDGKQLALSQNSEQKDHAAWLHVAIDEMMKLQGFKMKDLNAVAVTDGPGSYTGLRVGMSAAKGFCYALQIPLITESSLKVMAFAASLQLKNINESLLCPMIDARRMEVFTSLFKHDLTEIMPATAMILDENSFSSPLQSNKIYFFGSGRAKWEKLTDTENAFFVDVNYNSGDLAVLAHQKFETSQFTDIIYSQPAYIKDFHSYTKK